MAVSSLPQAGWSPSGQYQGSNQSRDAIYTGSYNPTGNNGSVYWIGQDGNVWLKSADPSGNWSTKNYGKAINYGDTWFDAANLSGTAQKINDPLAPVVTPNVNNNTKKTPTNKASTGLTGSVLGASTSIPTTNQLIDLGPSIDSLYAPELQSLDDLISKYGKDKQGYLDDAEKDFGTYGKSITGDYDLYNKQVKDQQDQANYNLKSAADEAYRAYNALGQQNLARFGTGSSAAKAIGELAQQEFFRNQGNLAQTQNQTDREFANQFATVNKWKQDKGDELDRWYRDTKKQIGDAFDAKIQSLNDQKIGSTKEKSMLKLQELKDTMAKMQGLEDLNKQLKGQLGEFAISQLSINNPSAITPELINNMVQGIGMNRPSGPQYYVKTGNQAVDDQIANYLRGY